MTWERAEGRVKQVNQARLAHIGSNKLRSEFDGVNEKSQITRGGRTETNLLGKDVSTAHHVRQGRPSHGRNRQRTE